MKEGRSIVLLITEKAFYGGVRATLREVIDEMVPSGLWLRKLLDEREAWFRFTICSFREVLDKVHSWYEGGELGDIRLLEVDSRYKFTPPPQEDIQDAARILRDSDYGPIFPKTE